MKLSKLGPLAALAVLAIAAGDAARACTGIRLTADDGAVVYARTLEFDADLDSNVIIIPRNLALHGTTRSGRPGLQWHARYGAAGMNGQQQMILVDGVNERGLAGGLFYMPNYAQYETVTVGDESRTLAPWELMNWILTSFATVEEVRMALPTIKVADVTLTGWPSAPEVHYIVHDAKGNSLVIEYVGGKPVLHDNPLGVITNAPDFDWHVKNLNNYLNLTATNAASSNLGGLQLKAFGQGSGLLGIPGDFTPPSRFVRAAFLSQSASAGENGPQAIRQAFHVLDGFDIPRGAVRGVEDGHVAQDYTQWTSASDTKNRIYYFHTHANRRIRSLELARTNLDAPTIVTLPRDDDERMEDITPVENEQ